MADISIRHWSKLDHITFLIAMILVAVNIFINSRELQIVIFILMLIALIYDIFYE
jgi:hypothetical protein